MSLSITCSTSGASALCIGTISARRVCLRRRMSASLATMRASQVDSLASARKLASEPYACR